MEIFAKDLLIGDFRTSDFGLIVSSFSYDGNSDDDIGFTVETIEKYIGNNSVPVYLGQKYTDKLKPQITLSKNPCSNRNNIYFTEYECRAVLRKLTGIRGYQWMKLIDESIGEDVWYRLRINSVSYKRVGGHVAGIILGCECDSSFAWSTENIVFINAKANKPFYIFNNTDDLNNYILPYVEITSLDEGNLSISNASDNNWTVEINNIRQNEIITMDCKNEVATSNIDHRLLLNDTNLHWFRLVPDKNEYVSNLDVALKFVFRVPRKVGFAE